MNFDSSAFRKATLFTLLIAVPALLVICTTVAGRYSLVFARDYYIQIIAGFSAMYLFSEFVGLRFRSYLYKYFLGGLYGIVVFLIGCSIGSITSTLVYRDSSFDYIWKPLYWLSMFGVIPAFMLGLMFTHFLRRFRARNTAEHGARASG